jgi:hypothetical protein
MKRLAPTALLLLLTLACLTSCGKEAEAVSIDKLKTCPAEFDKKDVTVEGYLAMDSEVREIYCLMRCSLEVNSEPASGPRKLVAQVEMGTGPNQIEEAREFMSDQSVASRGAKPDEEYIRRLYEGLRVHAADGKLVRLREKVKLTGKLEVFPREGNCFLKVERIEQQ